MCLFVPDCKGNVLISVSKVMNQEFLLSIFLFPDGYILIFGCRLFSHLCLVCVYIFIYYVMLHISPYNYRINMTLYFYNTVIILIIIVLAYTLISYRTFTTTPPFFTLIVFLAISTCLFVQMNFRIILLVSLPS